LAKIFVSILNTKNPMSSSSVINERFVSWINNLLGRRRKI
jgi:hypothetical protein